MGAHGCPRGGKGLSAAVARAQAYVAAGADMIFAEAITTLAEFRQFTSAVSVPVLANITEFGRTPLFSAQELGEAGVRLALYPLSAFRAMSRAAEAVYHSIRTDGTHSVLNWRACRPARSCMPCWAITPTRRSWIGCSAPIPPPGVADERDHPATLRVKKSVALAGVTAGSTALCTVGQTGNDLHYRGYEHCRSGARGPV